MLNAIRQGLKKLTSKRGPGFSLIEQYFDEHLDTNDVLEWPYVASQYNNGSPTAIDKAAKTFSDMVKQILDIGDLSLLNRIGGTFEYEIAAYLRKVESEAGSGFERRSSENHHGTKLVISNIYYSLISDQWTDKEFEQIRAAFPKLADMNFVIYAVMKSGIITDVHPTLIDKHRITEESLAALIISGDATVFMKAGISAELWAKESGNQSLSDNPWLAILAAPTSFNGKLKFRESSSDIFQPLKAIFSLHLTTQKKLGIFVTDAKNIAKLKRLDEVAEMPENWLAPLLKAESIAQLKKLDALNTRIDGMPGLSKFQYSRLDYSNAFRIMARAYTTACFKRELLIRLDEVIGRLLMSDSHALQSITHDDLRTFFTCSAIFDSKADQALTFYSVSNLQLDNLAKLAAIKLTSADFTSRERLRWASFISDCVPFRSLPCVFRNENVTSEDAQVIFGYFNDAASKMQQPFSSTSNMRPPYYSQGLGYASALVKHRWPGIETDTYQPGYRAHDVLLSNTSSEEKSEIGTMIKFFTSNNEPGYKEGFEEGLLRFHTDMLKNEFDAQVSASSDENKEEDMSFLTGQSL